MRQISNLDSVILTFRTNKLDPENTMSMSLYENEQSQEFILFKTGHKNDGTITELRAF